MKNSPSVGQRANAKTKRNTYMRRGKEMAVIRAYKEEEDLKKKS